MELGSISEFEFLGKLSILFAGRLNFGVDGRSTNILYAHSGVHGCIEEVIPLDNISHIIENNDHTKLYNLY